MQSTPYVGLVLLCFVYNVLAQSKLLELRVDSQYLTRDAKTGSIHDWKTTNGKHTFKLLSGNAIFRQGAEIMGASLSSAISVDGAVFSSSINEGWMLSQHVGVTVVSKTSSTTSATVLTIGTAPFNIHHTLISLNGEPTLVNIDSNELSVWQGGFSREGHQHKIPVNSLSLKESDTASFYSDGNSQGDTNFEIKIGSKDFIGEIVEVAFWDGLPNSSTMNTLCEQYRLDCLPEYGDCPYSSGEYGGKLITQSNRDRGAIYMGEVASWRCFAPATTTIRTHTSYINHMVHCGKDVDIAPACAVKEFRSLEGAYTATASPRSLTATISRVSHYEFQVQFSGTCHGRYHYSPTNKFPFRTPPNAFQLRATTPTTTTTTHRVVCDSEVLFMFLVGDNQWKFTFRESYRITDSVIMTKTIRAMGNNIISNQKKRHTTTSLQSTSKIRTQQLGCPVPPPNLSPEVNATSYFPTVPPGTTTVPENTTCKLTCVAGGAVFPKEMYNCQSNDEWEPDILNANCNQNSGAICAILGSQAAGGTWQCNGNVEGNTCQLTCDIGWTLVAASTSTNGVATCDPQGNWQGAQAVCQQVQCVAISSVVDGIWSYNGNLQCENVPVNKTCSLACAKGFALTESIGEARCAANGTWTWYSFKCEKTDCGANKLPVQNGQWGNDGTLCAKAKTGEQCTVLCDENRRLEASGTATCTSSGWKNTGLTLPKCILKPLCPPVPKLPPFSSLSNPQPQWYLDNKAIVQCDSGPVKMFTCVNNGKNWNPVNVTCPIIQCQPLPLIAHGVVTYQNGDKPSYQPNEQVSFNCTKGFHESGKTTMTCKADGTWEDFDPVDTRCAENEPIVEADCKVKSNKYKVKDRWIDYPPDSPLCTPAEYLAHPLVIPLTNDKPLILTEASYFEEHSEYAVGFEYEGKPDTVVRVQGTTSETGVSVNLQTSIVTAYGGHAVWNVSEIVGDQWTPTEWHMYCVDAYYNGTFEFFFDGNSLGTRIPNTFVPKVVAAPTVRGALSIQISDARLATLPQVTPPSTPSNSTPPAATPTTTPTIIAAPSQPPNTTNTPSAATPGGGTAVGGVTLPVSGLLDTVEMFPTSHCRLLIPEGPVCNSAVGADNFMRISSKEERQAWEKAQKEGKPPPPPTAGATNSSGSSNSTVGGGGAAASNSSTVVVPSSTNTTSVTRPPWFKAGDIVVVYCEEGYSLNEDTWDDASLRTGEDSKMFVECEYNPSVPDRATWNKVIPICDRTNEVPLVNSDGVLICKDKEYSILCERVSGSSQPKCIKKSCVNTCKGLPYTNRHALRCESCPWNLAFCRESNKCEERRDCYLCDSPTNPLPTGSYMHVDPTLIDTANLVGKKEAPHCRVCNDTEYLCIRDNTCRASCLDCNDAHLADEQKRLCIAALPQKAETPLILGSFVPVVIAAIFGNALTPVLGEIQQLALVGSCGRAGDREWALTPFAFITLSKEDRVKFREENEANQTDMHSINILINVIVTVGTLIGSLHVIHTLIVFVVSKMLKKGFQSTAAILRWPNLEYVAWELAFAGVAFTSFRLLFQSSVHGGYKLVAALTVVSLGLYCAWCMWWVEWLVDPHGLLTRKWHTTPSGKVVDDTEKPKFALSKVLSSVYWCAPSRPKLMGMHSTLVRNYTETRYGYQYTGIHLFILWAQCGGASLQALCKNRILIIGSFAVFRIPLFIIWRPLSSPLKNGVALVVKLLSLGELVLALKGQLSEVPSDSIATGIFFAMAFFVALYGIIVLLEYVREFVSVKKLHAIDILDQENNADGTNNENPTDEDWSNWNDDGNDAVGVSDEYDPYHYDDAEEFDVATNNDDEW